MGICATPFLMPKPTDYAAADRGSYFVQTIRWIVFFGSSLLNRTSVCAEKSPPN